MCEKGTIVNRRYTKKVIPFLPKMVYKRIRFGPRCPASLWLCCAHPPLPGIFQQFIILSFISFPQSFNHFLLRISAFQETEPFPLSYHQTRPPSSCTVSFKLPQHKLQTGCLWAILPSRLGPCLWVGSREVNVIELWMNLTKHTLKYTHLRLEVSGLLFSALLNCS